MSAARWLGALLLVVALAAGCADDDPSGDPTTAPTDSPSASSASPSESTAGPETSVSPTPPAGPVLEEQTSRLQAPGEDWTPVPEVVDYASSLGRQATGEVISLSDRESFAAPATLDEQVEFLRGSLPKGAVVERQPDVTLDGAPAYYVQWSERGDQQVHHDIGLDHEGQVISVNLTLDAQDPEAAEAVVVAVVASFTWR